MDANFYYKVEIGNIGVLSIMDITFKGKLYCLLDRQISMS
jgi:hypothetical protein